MSKIKLTVSDTNKTVEDKLKTLSKEKLISIILRKDDVHKAMLDDIKALREHRDVCKDLSSRWKSEYEDLCDKTATTIAEKNKIIRKQRNIIDILILLWLFLAFMIVWLLV